MNLELIPKLQQVDLLNKARKIKTALKIVHITSQTIIYIKSPKIKKLPKKLPKLKDRPQHHPKMVKLLKYYSPTVTHGKTLVYDFWVL